MCARAQGAGGSSSADNDPIEDGDEDLQMTQEVRTNFKCPFLQQEMEPTGEMRPMRAAQCKTPQCFVSYKGMLAMTKNGKAQGTCPSCKCAPPHPCVPS